MVKMFDEKKDYRTLCSWWESHGLPIPPVDILPPTGLLVERIAAGFLIIANCNLAILDFYISNPESDKKMRDIALDQITKELISLGQKVGISNFKCDSQLQSVKNRADRFGFKYIGDFSTYFARIEG